MPVEKQLIKRIEKKLPEGFKNDLLNVIKKKAGDSRYAAPMYHEDIFNIARKHGLSTEVSKDALVYGLLKYDEHLREKGKVGKYPDPLRLSKTMSALQVIAATRPDLKPLAEEAMERIAAHRVATMKLTGEWLEPVKVYPLRGRVPVNREMKYRALAEAARIMRNMPDDMKKEIIKKYLEKYRKEQKR